MTADRMLARQCLLVDLRVLRRALDGMASECTGEARADLEAVAALAFQCIELVKRATDEGEPEEPEETDHATCH